MNVKLDTRSKLGIGLGWVVGIVCIISLSSPIFGLIIGTATATIVARPTTWKSAARYGGLVSLLIFGVFVMIIEFGNLNGSSDFDFFFFDHFLYLLIFGGFLSLVVGATCGAAIAQLFAFYTK